MKNIAAKTLAFACGLLLFGGTAHADLLNVILGTPLTFFLNGNSNGTSFDATTGKLSVTGSLINTDFGSGAMPGSGTVYIDIVLDGSGMPSGVSGDDFQMTGTVTDGTNTYSGVLLKGEVSQ